METIAEEEPVSRSAFCSDSGRAHEGDALDRLQARDHGGRAGDGVGITGFGALQTLTSGQKRDVPGGSIQAHVCVISRAYDVDEVLRAFHQADAFKKVVNFSFAFRFMELEGGQQLKEGSEDGVDEGCGDKLLSVLRRFALQGLLLIVSRWQDYGATPGLEAVGTSLYSAVVERAKDLITSLQEAMGLAGNRSSGPGANNNAVGRMGLPPPPLTQFPPVPKTHDFSSLPALPEPRIAPKYGPNHFLSAAPSNRQASAPNLFSGGDVRLWLANDQCLRGLPDSELYALRSLRQPDWRIEEVLQAVAVLRGQPVRVSASAAARWGQYKEMLKSPTLRTELLLFDASQVSAGTAQQALQLLDGLDVEDIRRASPGAASLFEWARGVARWRSEGPPASASSTWQAPPAQAAAAALVLRLPSRGKATSAPLDGASSTPPSTASQSLRKTRSVPQLKPAQYRCAGFTLLSPAQLARSKVDLVALR